MESQPDGKRLSLNACRQRVAGDVSFDPLWFPQANHVGNRRNPWHPSMDDIMFYV
jgi:hypothetical protein